MLDKLSLKENSSSIHRELLEAKITLRISEVLRRVANSIVIVMTYFHGHTNLEQSTIATQISPRKQMV